MSDLKEARLTVRVNGDLHEWVKVYAQRVNKSMSVLVIDYLESLRQHNGSTARTAASESDLAIQLQRADSEIQYLRDQLSEKDNQLSRRDEQIDALQCSLDHNQQLLAMQTKTTAVLTEQNQLLLEDNQKPPQRKGFWSFLLYR